MFELVVVVLEGALRVVGRIDEDALHLSRVERDQRLESQQIIALDQQIIPVRSNFSITHGTA